MTANYSAAVPEKVDDTFVFLDTSKVNDVNKVNADKNDEEDNNNQSKNLPRDNDSVINRSERNSGTSNGSDSKLFHIDTAPGSP